MLHIETAHIAPAFLRAMRKLKIGCALYETNVGGEYLLGTPKRAIRITSSDEKFIALELIAGKSESEISNDVDAIALNKILIHLESKFLINSRKSALQVSKRFISKLDNRIQKNSKGLADAALIQLQSRSAPELHQTNWIKGVDDGGVEILSKRQNYLVEISGTNRVATILYSLLLASGATHVRFSPDSRGRSLLINDLDLAVSTLSSSDIGTNFNLYCESKRKELSLFPLERDHNYLDEISTPELRIHCGEIDPEKLSGWMSSGQRFLLIPSPHADSAQIGPLVLPGDSPCMRCFELSAREQNQPHIALPQRSGASVDYPQVAAHFIAALAASHVLQFLDSLTFNEQKVELVGNVITIDYQFLSHPQTVAIARHPLCGCAF